MEYGNQGRDLSDKGGKLSVDLYSLLFVDRENACSVNLRETSEKLEVYVGCAILLGKSLANFGYHLTILTNDEELISKYAKDAIELGVISIQTIEFATKVQNFIPFKEAHYKLDVLRFFSRLSQDRRVAFLDLDIVALRAPQFPQLQWDEDRLFVYDITEMQVAQVGQREIDQAFRVLTKEPMTQARWYGGEFIAGRPLAFSELVNTIEDNLDSYWANIWDLPHIGDETFVSAALNQLAISRKVSISEANDESSQDRPLINRWWSARTLAQQVPLRNAARAGLLHLPSDKEFLCSAAKYEFSSSGFYASYRKHASRKILVRKVANVWDSLQNRGGLHVPNL
jgi:hypothetical protein